MAPVARLLAPLLSRRFAHTAVKGGATSTPAARPGNADTMVKSKLDRLELRLHRMQRQNTMVREAHDVSGASANGPATVRR